MQNLKTIITQNLPLEPIASGGGWHRILCKVCGDRGHKGKRAGFKFEGDKVIYHCFNNSCGAVFDPAIHKSIPDKMVKVLTAFGISSDQYKELEFSLFATIDGKPSSKSVMSPIKYPDEIQLPAHFYKLENNDDTWSNIAILYLEERGILVNDYTFFLSTHKDWIGRLIIPMYKDGKLIFYHGRDMTGKKSPKYKNVDVIRNSIMYGYDQLYQNISSPLFVTEGFFDSFMVNGVAVLSNKMTDDQMKILSNSPRQKIIVPDIYGRGYVLAEQGFKLGWSIAFPDIGNCKDINEAVQKYGKMYVFKTLHDNIKTGLDAEIAINGLLKN